MKEYHTVSSLVDAATLGAYFGVSTKTIANYRTKGMPQASRGKYNVKECIEWKTALELQSMKEELDKGILNITEEDAKIRKLVAEARLKELEVAQMEEVLILTTDAAKELERHVSVVRAGLLSFPSRVAPFLVSLPDEATARTLMTTHIHALMDGMTKNIEEYEQSDDLEDEAEDEEE